VFCYSAGLNWRAEEALRPLGAKAMVSDDFDVLLAAIITAARKGDHVLIMSNGGFGGIHDKLLKKFSTK
jgi:UDP-N-acetylmuramate: L-alanyl-gamma-D-glutamyl-meso-diaminopimelate ligase